MSSVSIEEAIDLMAAASPGFADLWAEWKLDWEDPQLPYISLFASFAMDLLRSDNKDPAELARVFEAAEVLMTKGDQYVGEVIATGLLEQVLSEASAGNFNFEEIRSLIGPASSKYCVAWNRRTLGADNQRFDP